MFTWESSRNPTKQTAPRVNTIQFGDGYSQRIPDGIHNIDETWRLDFKDRTLFEIDQINDFLLDAQGFISFLWVEPWTQEQIPVICEEWSKGVIVMITETTGYGSLTATFKRVYD
jgi:phage-related protein